MKYICICDCCHKLRVKEAKEGRDIYVSHEGCVMVPTTNPCYTDMESDSTLRSVLESFTIQPPLYVCCFNLFCCCF